MHNVGYSSQRVQSHHFAIGSMPPIHNLPSGVLIFRRVFSVNSKGVSLTLRGAHSCFEILADKDTLQRNHST
jgi:hypothetical protein